MNNLQLLQRRLNKIEKELNTCRTSVLQDGWQTQRFAKKSRKWDFLAQEKMRIKQLIENEVNNLPEYYHVFLAEMINGKTIKLWRANDGKKDIYTEYGTDNIINERWIVKIRKYEEK
jgi:hypothetical protein